jgi:hypothetical protein
VRESSNGKFRDGCPRLEWFPSRPQAKVVHRVAATPLQRGSSPYELFCGDEICWEFQAGRFSGRCDLEALRRRLFAITITEGNSKEQHAGCLKLTVVRRSEKVSETRK